MRKLSAILTLLSLACALRAQDAVSTVAGQAQVSGAANGSGTNALFSDPAAIVMDAGGNYFIADSRNHAIRKVTTNGVVTTFAGKLGVSGSANATGTNASFNTPCGLAFDDSGNLYVSDTGNNVIRKITPAKVVTTFAGVAGSGGFLDGASGSALFNSPLGITVATNGAVFLADSGNHCIRKISASGNVTTFAGSPQIWGSANGPGTNAQFNGPCGLKFDARGNLFVSDANNNTIRKITTNGMVTTFAGISGKDGAVDGDFSSALFSNPADLAFDSRGNLFVADSLNQTIRKLSTNGLVTTVCGKPGKAGSANGANGIGRFFNPYSLVVAPDGSVVVADTYNQSVRSVIIPFDLTMNVLNSKQTTILNWDTVKGKTYQVQLKKDLAGGWVNLDSPIKAIGVSMLFTNVNPDSINFYRIIRLD